MVMKGVPEGLHCPGDKQSSWSSEKRKQEAVSSGVGVMQNNRVEAQG